MMTAESLESAIRSVLLSRNERRIRAFALQWGIVMPKKPTLFWVHVNRQIAQMDDAPKEERDASRRWLKEHGVEV